MSVAAEVGILAPEGSLMIGPTTSILGSWGAIRGRASTIGVMGTGYREGRATVVGWGEAGAIEAGAIEAGAIGTKATGAR